MERYACPCCGYKTLFEGPTGTYQICPVCFWEDDPVQFDDIDFEGGANRLSLRQYQKKYLELGYAEEGIEKFVRKPLEEEARDLNWKPFV